MSTRTRSRPAAKSYTARLRQRTGARQRERQVHARIAVTGRVPASVAVVAELNHLVAALVEWPDSPVRGVVHVLVAAVLGVFAATAYFAPGRVLFGLGVGLGLVAPFAWLVSADYPVAAGIGGAVVEVALAGLLVWRVRGR